MLFLMKINGDSVITKQAVGQFSQISGAVNPLSQHIGTRRYFFFVHDITIRNYVIHEAI